MSVDLIGQTFAGRYRLEAVLGQGGMGVVFAALDLNLGREVAVKAIRKEHMLREKVIADFIQEAKIIAQLANNPHILTVCDLVTVGIGAPFIVTERLRGRTLKVLIREQLASRSWVLEVGMQVTLALVDVHARGIVHRDLKPGNIFIVETSVIPLLTKVIDFGLSTSPQLITNREGFAGTAGYLAPEVATGQPRPASDIYSLGVTLYELATGIHPYQTAGAGHAFIPPVAAKISKSPLVDGKFPDSFTSLVFQMMETDYRNRPTAAECLAELHQANRDLNQSKRRN